MQAGRPEAELQALLERVLHDLDEGVLASSAQCAPGYTQLGNTEQKGTLFERKSQKCPYVAPETPGNRRFLDTRGPSWCPKAYFGL